LLDGFLYVGFLLQSLDELVLYSSQGDWPEKPETGNRLLSIKRGYLKTLKKRRLAGVLMIQRGFCKRLKGGNTLMKHILAGAVVLMSNLAANANPTVRLAEAHKLRGAGNHAEAYVVYTNLVLDARVPAHIGTIALPQAVACLGTLSRDKEADALLESAATVHAGNWRMLAAVAGAYRNLPPHGVIVAGTFERGHHRGGGRWVSSGARDRVRALRLYASARRLAQENSQTGAEVGSLLLAFATAMMPAETWRMQLLTDLADPSDPSDLSDLPDYDEFQRWGYGGGAEGFAPADAEGNPVFFGLPATYEAAANDGERWRALLDEAQRHYSPMASEILHLRAELAYRLYGVHTLGEFEWFFRRSPSDADTRAAAFALHTLDDGETIARLASGIKRFTLPSDWNFVTMFKTLAAKKATAGTGMDRLASIYENRRQYMRAATVLKMYIKQHGDDRQKSWRERLDQIVKPWLRIESAPAVPAGTAATLALRFRNGERVTFEVHKVKLPSLLDDVRQYLAGNPTELKYEKFNINNIAHRLIHQDEKKYLGEKVAKWNEALQPLPDHADRVVTITTPVKDAGAYLLTARMQDGNRSSIMLWIEDTVIAEKHLDGKTLYYVADALTGAPVQGATVDFFGYDTRYEFPRGGAKQRLKVETRRFAVKTDADGMVVPDVGADSRHFRWLVTASLPDPASAPDTVAYSRFAFLNFSPLDDWSQQDTQYNQSKAFFITDRPVYRPGNTAKFKCWVRHAQYDMPPDASRFAGQAFGVTITNPRNENILEKTFTADAFGGFDGDFALPEGAMLGVYRIAIDGQSGQGTFRVEEYKKPEFEVKVDAPGAPQMLGDVIKATVRADYLFGAPVTEATVKIKVTRTAHNTDFYPVGPWDWFYGNGYAWLGYDYDWYPGWRDWGCVRPRGWWWPVRQDPPELVAEIEQPLGKDGSVTVSIDTALAKVMHGDQDHRYTISAEVTDASRRTITGIGSVIAARDPFRVFVQVDRGYYQAGATAQATVTLRGADGSPMTGAGTATLYRVTYNGGTPVETAVESWPLATDVSGVGRLQFVAARAGQYRLAAVMRVGGPVREGAYVFTVAGTQAEPTDFRFNAIELVPEKGDYAAGETLRLRINTARSNSTVLLFVRPSDGVYLPPQVLRLQGKQAEVEIPVTVKDMPNFFVEALTISDAQVHSEVREIVVPPASRVLDVSVLPSAERCLPGADMRVKVQVRDADGKPFVGSTVLTVYDRAIEYISGGTNVPEIRAYFWKWRRNHLPGTRSSVDRWNGNVIHPGDVPMQAIGIFGHLLDERIDGDSIVVNGMARMKGMRSAGFALGMAGSPMMAMDAASMMDMAEAGSEKMAAESGEGGDGGEAAAVTVRTQFADTAFWVASLETDANGEAEVTFTMPESLTSWRVKAWTMGHGTRVGEGSAEVITTKNLLLRLQAPRFFVEKDVVTLSANIHNYFDTVKTVRAVLELDGGVLQALDARDRRVDIPAGGEVRVDWQVRATGEGEAVVRMKAIGDEESDAMQLRYPVYVHGMLKAESFSGVVRTDAEQAQITFTVPAERRPAQSRLEVRYSPTLAGAMVDALPYLASYPYGCTEQTINRFLPTVITQKILLESGVSLAAIRDKRSNLNAQEIGDDAERAKQWQRWTGNPVFDEAEVAKMVSEGVSRLSSMQNSDGGWGWFSGYGERSYAHTTVVVVRGLLVARANGAAIVPGVIENGLGWLRRYQDEQLARLEKPKDHKEHRPHADNLDANVHMTLVEGAIRNDKMTSRLYNDRERLSVYGKCLLGMTLHRLERTDELAMVLRNIEQVLVEDAENQTAWLEIGNGGYWWNWYGNEFEALAYYLKLLAATDPKAGKTAGLVKYLLNNRKHAMYWNSTRDTALCVEAMADYLRASGEGKPDMTVELLVDGEQRKSVRITPDALFDFDNRLVLEGAELADGDHTLTVRRTGKGPVYFNAYLTNFTLEDPIKAAGLEIKIQRQVYRLIRDDRDTAVAGSHGQSVSQRTERYRREPLASGATVASGELIEVELEIESKNDYEYIIVEDMKAAGFEAVEQRSGYLPNDMGAYVELRDDRVAFFVLLLARGRHSVAYRLRAEIPGQYSALPARAAAMYAPELKANSDEIKLGVGERGRGEY
jgi:uncharacterized protein YfaS (alpha-2-macroglobulin family)